MIDFATRALPAANTVCWFNSWVGAKGPWWMPDTIQQWVTK